MCGDFFMTVVMCRTVILYFLIVLSMRFMGKRQIGELSPTELVVTLMLSDLASVPMQDINLPLLYGIIPIMVLVIFEVILSFISLRSRKFRKFISGNPCVIIKDGIIDQNIMEKARITIDDLLEELRLQGFSNVDEIQYAVLETSGKLSIFPKKNNATVTCKDLNLDLEEEVLPSIIICDGRLDEKSLHFCGKDTNWLNKQYEKYKVKSIKDVFLLTVDENNKVIFIPKEMKSKFAKG